LWAAKVIDPALGMFAVMFSLPVILMTVFTVIEGWDKA
jgi:hypothetical protein